MKDNTQEKNLIEKEEKGIFKKIKSFFANIFSSKKQQKEDNEPTTMTTEENNSEFKEYIKITEDEETKLLELQERYRRGEIADNDLTDEQIDALSNLYDKQIAELKKAIAEKELKIAEYNKKYKAQA